VFGVAAALAGTIVSGVGALWHRASIGRREG
jgi:hypothetical protein